MKEIYNIFKEFTMVPELTYIENLNLINKFNHVDGCIVECGTWKGGMIAGIAKVLGNQRSYYLFDSFDGLPEVQNIDGELAIQYQKNTNEKNYFNNCKADIKYAEYAMKISGVDDYQIRKGWFKNTLPRFDNKIAILRLDGDWYESTMDCLYNLFDLVENNGLIIIDDYYAWEGCRKAVHDYLSWNDKNVSIMQWNNEVCFIVKNKNGLIK